VSTRAPARWYVRDDDTGRITRVERITRPSTGAPESTVLVQVCHPNGAPAPARPARVPARDLIHYG
jgi:hypothetical protein